jgi:hypothetical protein
MTEGAGDSTNEPEAAYANFFKVGHNAVEVVLDFGQQYSSWQEPRLHTRVVTSPVYAKAFLGLLSRSLTQYESAFGPIPESGSDDAQSE